MVIPPIAPTTKLKVLRRENYLCQRCKTYSAKLTFHHMIPKRMFEITRDLNDEKNIMLLCDRCHARIHKEENQWTPEEINWIVKKTQDKKTDDIIQNTKDEAIRKLLMLQHIIKKRSEQEKEELVDDLEK